ncbi:MAG TPA: Fic family protein [Candidatus Saccharimonadales bacterium]|nr:Fic family protein [Candidatus Saccharimonadales bacterium]
MVYDTDTDPYVDPATGVLRNSLGISDTDELAEAEADLTTVAIATLTEKPVRGNFDLAHLQAIHKRLFGAIYPWAGELRRTEMSKDSTRFASVDSLNRAANQLFDSLHKEKLLNGLTDEDYVRRLAHYYSEVNILHPFREGNGRTQRAFFSLLAAKSGRRIAWDLMDASKNLAASIKAYNGDESDLVKLLTTLIEAT